MRYGKGWNKYYLVLREKILIRHNLRKLKNKRNQIDRSARRCESRLRGRMDREKTRFSRYKRSAEHRFRLKLLRFKRLCRNKHRHHRRRYRRCYHKLKKKIIHVI